MIDHQTLQALKDSLSEKCAGDSMTLREFGRMLGRAIGRTPYSKSYVHELLNGDKPITPQVERAARHLMLGAAALGEDSLTDVMPTFDHGPVKKMKAVQAAGGKWQELYAQDEEVQEFVDALMNLIIRG